MPSTPSPRPFSQILKSMRQVFVTKSGVNDLFPGSSVNSFLEAASLSDMRSQGDIIAALNSTDIDRAEDTDLDNIGNGKGVPRPQARPSTGVVTLQSLNFKKISTKIYAGTAAPPIGSTVINVSDASLFPQTGSIYLGRGSNNIEGPIAYSSITPIGNYYQINLSTQTTKNHNINESVVLAQGGNRTVQIGQNVQTQGNATSPAVQFKILANVTIPDGEDSLQNVPVVCTQVGTRGNVPAGSITSFPSTPPFPGAGVTNPLDFITGKDKMSDADYRLKIKNFEQTKTKGTKLAVEAFATDVTSTDDNRTSTSAKLSEPSNRGEPSILYIDDGTAYQPIYSGQGFEQVVDDANGGEEFLQLQNEDVTKALVISSFTAPFALTGGMKLSIKVGGELSEHQFQDSDFATQNAADTFEIVNAINADTSLLFSARAFNSSTQVMIFAKDFQNEDIQVVAPSGPNDVDANEFLGFSSNLTYSLRLYKNDALLIKDGVVPTLFSLPQSEWAAMSSGETLTIQADQSQQIQYTFTDSDFVAFGFSVLSNNNPLSAWANVMNAKIAGVTVEVSGNQLKFTSNKGANNLAQLIFTFAGSSLASKMFGLSAGQLQSIGKASDYSLNRSTGQIELAVPLSPGDVITAGSKNTRAFVDSIEISTGSVTVPPATVNTAPPILWVTLDQAAQYISNTANTSSQITITNPSTNVWRFTSSEANAFANVAVNDWVIIADDAIWSLDNDFIGYWRVSARANNYFEIRLTNSLGTTGGPIGLVSNNSFSFIRSYGSIQQLNLLTGLQTLTAIANNINTQLQGGFASSVNGKVLRLTTDTYALNGFIMLAGSTNAPAPLGFVVGAYDSSTVTHTAFAESGNSEVTIPTFVHDSIASGTSAVPPINLVTNTSVAQFVNDWISFLNPYGKISSNKSIYAMSAAISGTSLTLRPQDRLRDVLSGDRYFVANPFNFEANDNLVVILDDDSVNKSLNIKMARHGTVNGATAPTQNQFTAYDTDAGPTANYANQFGNNFDFKDFFIYLKARQIVNPNGPNNEMLFSSAKYGPTGEQLMIGIAYPTQPGSPITSFVSVDRHTKIKLYLSSGSERLGGAWDSTTQFDVTNPAGNTWRYTWNGVGTSPNFVSSATVAVGDIVNIDITSNFSPDNTGVYQISAVTNTYFEITQFYGVVENNIQLNATSDLRMYPLNGTNNTATLLAQYVASNLSSYFTISQLESGAGVITTSTFDDQAGSSEFVQLVDGFNAVSLSNIGTTFSPVNQFQLKVPLQIPQSSPNYTLVGQDFYLIPATSDQIQRFLNIFAVTGLSSLGNIGVSSDAGKVQIYSSLFGSSGSVLVSGGSANSATGALLTTGALVVQGDIEDQPHGLVRSGSNVIVATKDRHGLFVGDSITISNPANPTFIGTFPITATTARTFTIAQAQPTLNITSVTRSSNVVTVVTSTPHQLAIGDYVTLTGVTDTSYDGTFKVVSTSVGTSFTFNQLGVNSSSSGGSIINVASGTGEVLRPFVRTSIGVANQAGFQAGQWIKFANTATQAKDIQIGQTTQMSITGFNTLNITSGPGTFQTARTTSANSTTQIKVEKQAQFIVFSWTGTGTAPNFAGGGVQEGDWVKVSGNFNAVNQGIYKVERMYNDSFYVVNVTGLEEEVTMAGNSDLSFYAYDSVMPGDELILGDTILGALNKGTYVVASSPFPTATAIAVTPSFATNQSSTVLGPSVANVTILEKAPFFAYRQLLNITPDPANINGFAIITDNAILPDKLNISAGTGMSAVSKLGFTTTVQIGEDSYKHWMGLIHEVGKVIRGQATDPTTYPGVGAAGSFIEISSPLPKRIQVAIVVRDRTGVSFNTIKSRVQNAVAAYINSLGVGEPVVFSEIVSTVQEINGIQAVSISSPTYNSTNDQIISQFNEKPVVQNITTDVIVSQAV